jgi:hypothetical protein
MSYSVKKLDGETTSFPFFAFDGDFSSMFIDKFFDNGQSNAGAGFVFVFVERDKSIEKFLLLFFGNADSFVFDFNG